jgi:ubiquinone/menaquinone biosynthesis C-methylase UbiE
MWMSDATTVSSPRTSAEELATIEHHFDACGFIWINAYGEAPVPWNKYPIFRLREQYACEMVQNEGRDLAVDLGCGPGHALLRMIHLGFQRAVGVDISDKMLDSAKELIRQYDLRERVAVCKSDVCDVTMLDSNSVDACTALGVIEYLKNERALLSEIYRFLKPGGVAVVQTRNGAWIHHRLRALVRAKPQGRIWYQTHSPARLRRLAEETGFVVEQEMFSHYHALYPFDLMPGISRAVRPLDVFISKKLERFYRHRISRWFTATYLAKLRKR